MKPRLLPFVDVTQSARRTYVYYRRDGRRVRLPDPSDPRFADAYARVHATWNHDFRAVMQPGTIVDLIRHYQASPSWEELAERTRKDYRPYLRLLEDMIGDYPVAAIDREALIALRDRYRATPAKANHLIRIVSLLLSFAQDRPSRFHLNHNPALRLKKFKTKGGGHRPWTPGEVSKFTSSNLAQGIRLAFEIAILTGQRQCDVLTMKWTSYADGRLHVLQSKTGVELSIPAGATLAKILDESPRSAETMVVSITGRPFKADNFRHQFARAVRAAGLGPGLTFHGLRKTLTSLLAAAECTNAEIRAVTGHLTDQMVRHYIGAAEQATRADAAIEKLERLMNRRRA